MEVKELFDLEKRLLDNFFENTDFAQIEKLVDLLLKSKGLVFLTGVGKSGLIANKIAVTMTSTGTRALWLSPTDSLHGDIGLVSKDDIVFLLSKSGESDELLNMLPILRNKGATIVAVVMNPSSRLAKAAHILVNLPFERELCPFDMAPTLSTTQQLIFGDILAISLMKKKGFTEQDFASNHPAGRLGKRITMRVEDLMIKDPNIPFCSPDDNVRDILVELSDKRAGCLIIVNQEKELLGIFTDGDLRRSLQIHGDDVLNVKVGSLMVKNPKYTHPEVLALEAMKVMEGNQKHPIMVLPVVDKAKKVIGLIKLHDILQSGV